MIARQQEIGLAEILQNLLQQVEFFRITEFRYITTENGEVYSRIGIDVLNGLPQVIFGISEGIEVYIAEPGESKGSFFAVLPVGED